MAKAQKLGLYQRIDDGVARIEGAIAVFVLLSMVFVASAQALFFNIAQQNVEWAVSVVESLSWVDIFLQKGTLWLAFVGASMATHEEKHIALDVVQKLAPPSVALGMRRFASFGAGIIALLLAWVFLEACSVADAAVPFEYELLGNNGPIHLCDAAAAELGDASVPSVLCLFRALLAGVGVTVTSGGGVAQLIAPVMLFSIGVRLVVRSVLGGHRAPAIIHAQGTAGGKRPAADESKSDESKSDESKSDESKSDESKSDESKSDESKSDESKSDESKSDESKSDESKE